MYIYIYMCFLLVSFLIFICAERAKSNTHDFEGAGMGA